MSRESEALLARVRQIRRALAPGSFRMPAQAAPSGSDRPQAPDPATAPDLPTRVAHLEQMVQGLQDAVYRESQRQDKRIEELERQIEPAALAAALSKDARERGI